MIAQSTPPDLSPASFKAARQPMLWAALAHSLGIVLGVYQWRPPLWWIVAGVVFVVAAAYYARRRSGLGWAIALAAFVIGGAFHIQARAGLSRVDASIVPFADRQAVQITAHVTKDGKLRTNPIGGLRQTVDVETEEVHTEARTISEVHSGIRLNIYADRQAEASTDDARNAMQPSAPMRVFHVGERIRFTGKLRCPHNFRNPGAFDSEAYLADNGIAALGSAKIEDVQLLPGTSASRVALWRSRLHRSVVAKVHELWPPREAALIDAMIIGEDAFIDRDIKADFQRSGTYHVLVVSGMNVSILAFVVFWTSRKLRVAEIPATMATIGLCTAYAFVTEVGAPVWRATLMCAVYLCTRLLYRDRALLNGIGSAALALLVYDPRQLLTASFQMTVACVLIVAGIGIPILDRTSQLYKRGLANWESNDYAALLPAKVAQFRLDLQLISSRLSLFLGTKWSGRLVRGAVKGTFSVYELIFVSAVMQMGLALPMACYFHRATSIGLPANLAVIPLTQFMMPAAVAALSLGYVSPPLAKLPALLTTFAIDSISGAVHELGALRISDLRVPMPSSALMTLAAASVVLAMWAARRHVIVASAGLAAMLASSVAIAFLAPSPQLRPGTLEVTSIDVGEGDSTLLVAPQGRTLLIDAGGPIGLGGSQFDFGEDVVSPYLWSRGISRLDAVAISHGHSDHASGMVAVLKNFRPKELWLGLEPPSEILGNVLSTAQALDVKVVRHWEGDAFPFGGATVEVLYPPRNAFVWQKPRNNDSMILRVSFDGASVLLEGDAEKQVERRVAALHHPQATLLKVGHHGSANATTLELLSSVKPSFAMISVGYGNSFGLPRYDTLQRLEAAGARVYRTDLDGAVSFYLDKQALTASVAALR